MFRHSISIGVLLLGLSLAPSPALAAPNFSAARDHYQKGTKAFELGLYQEAIDEYVAAYKIIDDPAILYNLAQSHRLAGHIPEALRFYRQYLVKSPKAENRAECEAKIAELTKTIEQQKKAQEMPPNLAMKSTQTAPPEPANEPKPEPKPEVKREPPPPVAAAAPPVAAADRNAGRSKKIAGIIIGVVGVACVAAGIGLGVLASKTADDVSAASRSGAAWDASKDSAGKTDQALEGVFLGVGAAAVVTGVVLFALGHRDASRGVAMVPSFSAHGASATLQLGF